MKYLLILLLVCSVAQAKTDEKKREQGCFEEISTFFDKYLPLINGDPDAHICDSTECGLSITKKVKDKYGPEGYGVSHNEVNEICLNWER